MPLDIPLRVAGNFMELRTDHYHSGVDLKTEGRQGLPVHAAAEGHVSRIKVGPWGYGLALYIDHPGGLTTVYGHLSRFAPNIAAYTLETQYRQRSFSIDVPVPSGALPVHAGEVVAFSGNTGGSSAPHLHFEVRRTSDQHALDPQSYGLDLQDDIPPTIRGIRLYALDTSSRVSPYPGRAVGFPTEGGQGHYVLRPGEHPSALGTIGIAVHAVDRYDGSANICGIRRLELRVNGAKWSEVRLDEVDFDKQRYVNARMDYALFVGSDMHYHRLYDLPNDRSGLLSGTNAGKLQVGPGDTLNLTITATDAAGNASTLSFVLTGADRERSVGWTSMPWSSNALRWDREDQVTVPGFRMNIPAQALYEDVPMRIVSRPGGERDLGSIFQVLDERTPLHRSAEVRFTRPELSGPLQEKALVVRFDRKGHPTPEGGRFTDGDLMASVRRFGTYGIRIDTVPPKLVPLDLRPDMRGRDAIHFRVEDDLSGLDEWSATLDGKWILLTYDPKQRMLTHTFDNHSEGPGERMLRVEVTDERRNRTVLERRFTR
ncbi:MAG: M23 family metallopeptidase [Flavobacteriales bacterium]|nr:M23 family metallopeptidase [Flavobacteriales bacterium]MCB9168666.1 M23 family metallopeptidase [Flavobacteriales bacterium]